MTYLLEMNEKLDNSDKATGNTSGKQGLERSKGREEEEEEEEESNSCSKASSKLSWR